MDIPDELDVQTLYKSYSSLAWGQGRDGMLLNPKEDDTDESLDCLRWGKLRGDRCMKIL